MAYGIKQFGEEYSNDYLTYITKDNRIISPFHDIPATEDGFKLVNVVNEIPRFTNAKKEINKEAEYNPIKQDVKNGQLRFVKSMYPTKGYIWNYGAIPQTWESTEVEDTRSGIKGDNDPIDAIEIGDRIIPTGKVYQAKVLGAIAMIDSGECDWKILVISKEDEMFSKMNSLEDIDKYKPGLLSVTREWFRNYKVADKEGNKGSKNSFANDEKYYSAKEAIEIIKETNRHWLNLIKEKEHKGISLTNTTQKDTPGYTEKEIIPTGPEYKNRPEPKEAEKFYYIC